MTSRIWAVPMLFLLLAPGPGAPPPAPAASRDPELRAVSWCGRRYDDRLDLGSDCRGEIEQRHAATEGIWGFETYRLAHVAYGDLTGDGQEDALLVFDVAVRPVLIQPHLPAVRAEVWVMQRSGDDLVRFTEDSAASPPTSVMIANGVATLEWVDHTTRCEERWRFGAVGELAVKSARTCGRATAAGPGSP